jgi:hypothetical protein
MSKRIGRRDFIKVTGDTAAIFGLSKYTFGWLSPPLLSYSDKPLKERSIGEM